MPRKPVKAVHNPPKREVCATCYMSQVLKKDQVMCENSASPHGPHKFVLFVPPPLKGLPLPAKNVVLSSKENTGPVKASAHQGVEGPTKVLDAALAFFSLNV